MIRPVRPPRATVSDHPPTLGRPSDHLPREGSSCASSHHPRPAEEHQPPTHHFPTIIRKIIPNHQPTSYLTTPPPTTKTIKYLVSPSSSNSNLILNSPQAPNFFLACGELLQAPACLARSPSRKFISPPVRAQLKTRQPVLSNNQTCASPHSCSPSAHGTLSRGSTPVAWPRRAAAAP